MRLSRGRTGRSLRARRQPRRVRACETLDFFEARDRERGARVRSCRIRARLRAGCTCDRARRSDAAAPAPRALARRCSRRREVSASGLTAGASWSRYHNLDCVTPACATGMRQFTSRARQSPRAPPRAGSFETRDTPEVTSRRMPPRRSSAITREECPECPAAAPHRASHAEGASGQPRPRDRSRFPSRSSSRYGASPSRARHRAERRARTRTPISRVRSAVS